MSINQNMNNKNTLNIQAATDNLGDEDIAKMMITENFESSSLDGNMVKLEMGMNEKDWKQVEFVSHTLKGTAAIIGAEKFSHISQRMNTYLKQRGITYDEDLIRELYGDLIVECKNQKVKIAEQAEREADLTHINKCIAEHQEWIYKMEKEKKKNKSGSCDCSGCIIF